jgi:hypothetical protein
MGSELVIGFIAHLYNLLLQITTTVSQTVSAALQQVFLVFTNRCLLEVSTDVPKPPAASATSFSLLTATLNQHRRHRYYDRRSVGQSVLVSADNCSIPEVVCPLWREDGSVVCSEVTRWFKSRRTHNHTLLFRPRLPKPGGTGPWSLYPPHIMFPFCHILQVAGLRWRYSDPPPHRLLSTNWLIGSSYIVTDGQSASRHWVSFLSPLTSRRAAVEVF